MLILTNELRLVGAAEAGSCGAAVSSHGLSLLRKEGISVTAVL